MSEASKPTKKPKSDAAWLKDLIVLARDWRISEEYLGIIVRARYPQEYEFGTSALEKENVPK